MRELISRMGCQAKRLKADEDGSVLVLAVVLMVPLLVFCLSVMNLGSIANEKIRLQNAADFAALSGNVWQARAMNLEGLLNTTVTASIVIEIAKIILTGVPPDSMPPKWIDLQMKAQQWIQEGFNKYWFGTGMVFLNGALNQTLTFPKPFRVPLYVYRYSFASALKGGDDTAPKDGSKTFGERGDDAEQYMRKRELRDAEPSARPGNDDDPDMGLFSWTKELTLFDATAYPKEPSHRAPLIKGDGVARPKAEDVKESLAALVDKDALLNDIEHFLEAMIRDNYKTDEGGVAHFTGQTRERILEYAKEELERIQDELLDYKGDTTIKIILPYVETVVGDNPVAAVLLRILPSIELGVELKEGTTKEIDDYANAAAGTCAGLYYKHELEAGHPHERYFDADAGSGGKEFFSRIPTEFGWVDGPRPTADPNYQEGAAICRTCGAELHARTFRRVPQFSDLVGYRQHQYSSEHGTHKHEWPKRAWYYLAFDMKFKVKVTADLKIDLSAILMGKYRGDKDKTQLDSPQNVAVKEAVKDAWGPYERNLYTMACALGKDLPFGPRLMRLDPAGKDLGLPAEDTEFLEMGASSAAVKQGRLPFMAAFGSARHWQRGDAVEEGPVDNTTDASLERFGNYYDESQSGMAIYYVMSWRGAPHLVMPGQSQEILDADGAEHFSDDMKAVRTIESLASPEVLFEQMKRAIAGTLDLSTDTLGKDIPMDPTVVKDPGKRIWADPDEAREEVPVDSKWEGERAHQW